MRFTAFTDAEVFNFPGLSICYFEQVFLLLKMDVTFAHFTENVGGPEVALFFVDNYSFHIFLPFKGINLTQPKAELIYILP